MARAKRYSEVKRLPLRRVTAHDMDTWKLQALRDELWDILIAHKFKEGSSIEGLAASQPDRRSAQAIESAIRRRMVR